MQNSMTASCPLPEAIANYNISTNFFSSSYLWTAGLLVLVPNNSIFDSSVRGILLHKCQQPLPVCLAFTWHTSMHQQLHSIHFFYVCVFHLFIVQLCSAENRCKHSTDILLPYKTVLWKSWTYSRHGAKKEVLNKHSFSSLVVHMNNSTIHSLSSSLSASSNFSVFFLLFWFLAGSVHRASKLFLENEAACCRWKHTELIRRADKCGESEPNSEAMGHK